jgi:translation elongation factor EF-G
MLQEKEWQARKEALRAQAEALRRQQEELRVQSEQLRVQQAEEERKMEQLERVMEAAPRRNEDVAAFKEKLGRAKAEYQAAKLRARALERAEREMERVDESVQEAEDELAEAENEAEESLDEAEDGAEVEFPDLGDVERKVQKAMERLARLDLPKLAESIREGMERGFNSIAPTVSSALPQGIGFDKVREQMGGRANTIMTRVSDEDLQTLDILVEAGLATSRSECAAMLLHEGIIARKDMIQKVRDTADQIRKLRESMREELRSVAAAAAPPKAGKSE